MFGQSGCGGRLESESEVGYARKLGVDMGGKVPKSSASDSTW
jgi:hypothetical protein